MSLEVVSLGCRMNLAESEAMRALLAGERDLVVVNSCAVTAEALRQTRQAIRRARRASPAAATPSYARDPRGRGGRSGPSCHTPSTSVTFGSRTRRVLVSSVANRRSST